MRLQQTPPRHGPLGRISLATDVVEFLLQGEFVYRGKEQAKKETDSEINNEEGISEGLFDLLRRANNCCRGGGNAPVCGHRLARPHRTDLFCGVVTDGEYKIELWGIQICKLIPTLAPETARRNMRELKLLMPRDAPFPKGDCQHVRGELGRPLKFRMASAMIERAELPVHRNNTL